MNASTPIDICNLVIIGNGFDLAHGLKTSYYDFLSHLVNTHCKYRSQYTDLLKLPHSVQGFDDLRKPGFRLKWEDAVNTFVNELIKNETLYKWGDIETQYYYLLMAASNRSIHRLNSEFDMLKKHLEDYLADQQLQKRAVDLYADFFGHLDTENTLILNFNYTNTLDLYLKPNSKARVIHIHGQLHNAHNPIIFGFAANNEESRSLLQKQDNEFMRNIKKHNYKRTANEKALNDYMQSHNHIEVSVLGHSCGLSDKLILNQIFNHGHSDSIRVFYHDGYESFYNSQVNIDRIMDNDELFFKLINFQDSIWMPQHNSTENQAFKDFIGRLQAEQQAKTDSYRHGTQKW